MKQSSNNDLGRLRSLAATALLKGAERIKDWAIQVKDDDHPGRFRTAMVSTMPANVISTCRVLEGVKNAGVYNEVVSAEDERLGSEWISGMKTEGEMYVDPAIIAAKPENSPPGEPWPPPALIEVVNRYAQGALKSYGCALDALPHTEPPNGWPNVQNAEKALDWIKNLPWDTSPYTAGSLSRHMAYWVLEWYKEGKVEEKLLIDILDFIYSIQNPDTGLFGNQLVDKQNLINGAFKLFTLIRDRLDLPLPYAKKIIDQVIGRFNEKNYDASTNGCSEWDNWYVLALSLDALDDKKYRKEEILELAALRITRIFDVFGKNDGGLGMWKENHPETISPGLMTTPADISQGTSSGLSVLSHGINVCVDILGLTDETKWSGEWRLADRDGNKEDEVFSERIAKSVTI